MIRFAQSRSVYPRGEYLFDGISNSIIVWRTSGSGGVTPQPPAAAEEGPHGPGWNLFQELPPKRVRADTLREEIERAVNLALGIETEDAEEAEEAADEIRQSVSEFVSEAPQTPDYAPMIEGLKHLRELTLTAAEYIAQVNAIMEAQRAREADDMEAFMLIARMA